MSINAQAARASGGRLSANKYLAFPKPLKTFSLALKMRNAWTFATISAEIRGLKTTFRASIPDAEPKVADTGKDHTPNPVVPMALFQQVQQAAASINKLPAHRHQEQGAIAGPVMQQLRSRRLTAAPPGRDFRARTSQAGNIKNWYLFRGFQQTLEFQVRPHVPILLRARGDQCPGKVNLYGNLRFAVSEKSNGKWTEREKIDGPQRFCGERWYVYTPKTDRIHVTGRGGFYLEVFEVSKAAKMP